MDDEDVYDNEAAIDSATFIDIDNLVTIKKWSDIFEREKHQSNLNAKEFALTAVLSHYKNLSPLKPCGLSSCHTDHGEGYLVVAANGVETHIGHICGSTHFPDLAMRKNEFKHHEKVKNYRDNLIKTQENLGDYTYRISALHAEYPNSQDLIDRVKKLLTHTLDEGSSQALFKRAERSDPDVSERKQLKGKELEIARETGGSDVETTLIFTIYGLGAVKGHKKIGKLLQVNLGTDISDLSEVDITKLSFGKLKAWSHKADNIDHSIKEAANILQDLKRFTNPMNVQRIILNKHLL